jgi:hypothetical protein
VSELATAGLAAEKAGDMCKSVDAAFVTTEAMLQSVNVVLGSVELAIPSPIILATESAVSVTVTGLTQVKTLYDTYESDKGTGTGIVADIQAGVAAVKSDLKGIEAAAHIDNPAVQAWISESVNLVGTVLQDVITNILPVVKSAHEAGSIPVAQAKQINAGMKEIRQSAVLTWDQILNSAGLPVAVSVRAYQSFHRAIEPHILGVRV